MTLAPACMARADYTRRLAECNGVTAQDTPLSALVWRLAWDAPAAGDIPRPMLQDAADTARAFPALSVRVWHHVAGATILGTYCCGTPAAHRDALITLARELEATL